MTSLQPSPLKSLPDIPGPAHGAPTAIAAGSAAPKNAARQGVPSARRSEPSAYDRQPERRQAS